MVQAVQFSSLVTTDAQGKFIPVDPTSTKVTTRSDGSVVVEQIEQFEKFRDDSLTGTSDVRTDTFARRIYKFRDQKLTEATEQQLVRLRAGQKTTRTEIAPKEATRFDASGNPIKTTFFTVLKDGDGSKFKVRTSERLAEQTAQETRRIREGRKRGEPQHLAQARRKREAMERAEQTKAIEVRFEQRGTTRAEIPTLFATATRISPSQPTDANARLLGFSNVINEFSKTRVSSTRSPFPSFPGARADVQVGRGSQSAPIVRTTDTRTTAQRLRARAEVLEFESEGKPTAGGFTLGAQERFFAGAIEGAQDIGSFIVERPKTTAGIVVGTFVAGAVLPVTVVTGVGLGLGTLTAGIVGTQIARLPTTGARTEFLGRVASESLIIGGVGSVALTGGARTTNFLRNLRSPTTITGTGRVTNDFIQTTFKGKAGDQPITGRSSTVTGSGQEVTTGRIGKNKFEIITEGDVSRFRLVDKKGRVIREGRTRAPSTPESKILQTTTTETLQGTTLETATRADIAFRGTSQQRGRTTTTRGKGTLTQRQAEFVEGTTIPRAPSTTRGTGEFTRTVAEPTPAGTTRTGQFEFTTDIRGTKLSDIVKVKIEKPVDSFFEVRVKGFGKRGQTAFSRTGGPDFGLGRTTRTGRGTTERIRTTPQTVRQTTQGLRGSQLRALDILTKAPAPSRFTPVVFGTGRSTGTPQTTGKLLGIAEAPTLSPTTPDIISGTGTGPGSDFISGPTSTPRSGTGTGSGSGTTPQFIGELVTTPPATPSTTSFTFFDTPFTPVPFRPGLPGLATAGGGLRGAFGGFFRGGRQARAFTPTLTSATFNITGPSSKLGVISGLGLRPIRKRKK